MRKKVVSDIIIAVAVIVLVISGYGLYKALKDYHDSDAEYESLSEEFIKENPKKVPDKEPTKAPAKDEPSSHRVFEDAEPPLTVDWEGLKAVNEDIVGWIYVDAQPGISYPIVQGENNSEYLHMTYKKSYLYAGSIFLNADNTSDFSDASSIVYGHNMRSGSMFGTLKGIMDQEIYDADPYFWILTPAGDYRYHIFSEFTTEDGTDAYMMYRDGGKDFLKWAQKMQSLSVVENDTELREDDFIVALSTCKGSGTDYRNVVMGVLCSSCRPAKHNYFEEDAHSAYEEERSLGFERDESTSYVLTEPVSGRSVATNGYDKETVVRDVWQDVYVKDDDCLIHYEMLPAGSLQKELAKTDLSSLKSDANYSEIREGELYREYLKTRDLLYYKVNDYRIGQQTLVREMYGFIQLGQDAVLKISVKEMRGGGEELRTNAKTLGALIDRIGWEEPPDPGLSDEGGPAQVYEQEGDAFYEDGEPY